jgi:hypothetical protein
MEFKFELNLAKIKQQWPIKKIMFVVLAVIFSDDRVVEHKFES